MSEERALMSAEPCECSHDREWKQEVEKRLAERLAEFQSGIAKLVDRFDYHRHIDGGAPSYTIDEIVDKVIEKLREGAR